MPTLCLHGDFPLRTQQREPRREKPQEDGDETQKLAPTEKQYLRQESRERLGSATGRQRSAEDLPDANSACCLGRRGSARCQQHLLPGAPRICRAPPGTPCSAFPPTAAWGPAATQALGSAVYILITTKKQDVKTVLRQETGTGLGSTVGRFFLCLE